MRNLNPPMVVGIPWWLALPWYAVLLLAYTIGLAIALVVMVVAWIVSVVVPKR